MAKRTKRTKSIKKRFPRSAVLAVCLVAALAIAGGAWAVHNHDNKSKTPTIPTNGNPNNPTKPYVNLSPPTSQDQQNNQSHKQALVDTGQSGTPTDANGKKAVTVIVTSATPTDINGYVTGVFENGGTCTAKLTSSSSGQVITLTSAGFQNASYTSCTPMHPNLSGSGWSLVLSYSSPTAEGSSVSQQVK